MQELLRGHCKAAQILIDTHSNTAAPRRRPGAAAAAAAGGARGGGGAAAPGPGGEEGLENLLRLADELAEQMAPGALQLEPEPAPKGSRPYSDKEHAGGPGLLGRLRGLWQGEREGGGEGRGGQGGPLQLLARCSRVVQAGSRWRNSAPSGQPRSPCIHTRSQGRPLASAGASHRPTCLHGGARRLALSGTLRPPSPQPARPRWTRRRGRTTPRISRRSD